MWYEDLARAVPYSIARACLLLILGPPAGPSASPRRRTGCSGSGPVIPSAACAEAATVVARWGRGALGRGLVGDFGQTNVAPARPLGAADDLDGEGVADADVVELPIREVARVDEHISVAAQGEEVAVTDVLNDRVR